MTLLVAVAAALGTQAVFDCSGTSSRYYTYDGSCNNLERPSQGKRGSFFRRGAEGVDADREKDDLPYFRKVSNELQHEGRVAARNRQGLNFFSVIFGQFVTHDVSETVRTRARMIPSDLSQTGEAEMFTSGQFLPDSVHTEDDDGVLQQTNNETSYLDLSPVYGTSKVVANALRAKKGGLLKTSNEITDVEDFVFQYPGRFFPFCQSCVNTSTTPPTPYDAFGILPGAEPFEQPNPRGGPPAPPCFVQKCFKPSPEIKCSVNPEWNRNSGKYRDIRYTMTREWLPLASQVPEAPRDPVINDPADQFFSAGDHRLNDNLVLLVIHGLFLRNHNNIARKLAKDHPTWSDEKLFQEARLQNTHEYQHIVYNELLPAFLGDLYRPKFGRSFDKDVDATVSNLFSTAAFRLHTMVPENLKMRYPDGRLQSPANGYDHSPLLANTLGVGIPDVDFVNNELPAGGQPGGALGLRNGIAFSGGEDALLKSALMQTGAEAGNEVVDGLRSIPVVIACQFSPRAPPPGIMLVDIAGATIARGRRHGLPNYDDVRAVYRRGSWGFNRQGLWGTHSTGSVYKNKRCNEGAYRDPLFCFRLVTGESYRSSPVAKKLRDLYRKVNRIDAYIGIQSEKKHGNSNFGLTQSLIIREQFERLRMGDRKFYTNALSQKAVRRMRRTVTMRGLLLSTFDVDVQRDAFFAGGQRPYY